MRCALKIMQQKREERQNKQKKKINPRLYIFHCETHKRLTMLHISFVFLKFWRHGAGKNNHEGPFQAGKNKEGI